MREENNPIRQKNLRELKALLFKKRKAIKAEMVKDTGLSVVTINSLVKELVKENIFLENSFVQQKTGGRQPIIFLIMTNHFIFSFQFKKKRVLNGKGTWKQSLKL